jgi:hypothetical protein
MPVPASLGEKDIHPNGARLTLGTGSSEMCPRDE